MTAVVTTRRGDGGLTILCREADVPKDDPRIEALGDLDEASAALGWARAVCAEALPAGDVHLQGEPATTLRAALRAMQGDLQQVMAEVAGYRKAPLPWDAVKWLERLVGAVASQAGVGTSFVVPGDDRASAALHVARTVLRRAERRLVALRDADGLARFPTATAYLNRAGDVAFVLAVVASRAVGTAA